MFVCLLCPDSPVDLPVVMLPGLPEHGQQHDRPLSRTSVRDPGRNITQPDPQFSDRSVLVIRPRAAEFGAFLGEHAADLADRFKSLSLRLSSQSRISGWSSKSCRRRIPPLTPGQITGQAGRRSPSRHMLPTALHTEHGVVVDDAHHHDRPCRPGGRRALVRAVARQVPAGRGRGPARRLRGAGSRRACRRHGLCGS